MAKVAQGNHGNWFATIKKTGEKLPCLKAQFYGARGAYHEPYHYDTSQSSIDYIDAIKQGRVLIRTYNKDGKPNGYLNDSIYMVEDVQHDETGLRCRVIDKTIG